LFISNKKKHIINIFYKDDDEEFAILDENLYKYRTKEELALENIVKVETIWEEMNWGQYQQILDKALTIENEKPSFSFINYRKAIIETCLIDWDLMDGNGQKLSILGNIANLQPSAMLYLYKRFEKKINISDEKKNNN